MRILTDGQYSSVMDNINNVVKMIQFKEVTSSDLKTMEMDLLSAYETMKNAGHFNQTM